MALGTVVTLVLLFLFVGLPSASSSETFGVTWSSTYAEELGLNKNEALVATLDDLKVREFRIPVYWNQVEKTPGVFNWQDLDHELDEIAARQGKVILAIGMKVPRWPECWTPKWAQALSKEEGRVALDTFLRTVVTRYAKHSAIIAWQVENEPFFPFGKNCPLMLPSDIAHETALVREADRTQGTTHPVYSTDSGEFSPWIGLNHFVDGLGVSVYRVTWNAKMGIQKYLILPPWYYARKALLVSLWQKYVYVSEFLMEPWVLGMMKDVPFEEQEKTFSLQQMKENIAYAKRMEMKEIYFWGVEWWYWMKTQGHPEFWEEMKKVF
jgi:hypothetical protein